MTEQSKTVNFTDTQTAEVVAVYTAAKTDEGRAQAVSDLASRFDKTVHSIRGKLVSEGAYVAKATTKAAKGEVTTKASLVNAIGILAGTSANLGSLEKATKGDLQALADALVARSEDINKATVG